MIIREIVVWLWGSDTDKENQRHRLYYRWKDFKITGNHLFWAFHLRLFGDHLSAGSRPRTLLHRNRSVGWHGDEGSGRRHLLAGLLGMGDHG